MPSAGYMSSVEALKFSCCYVFLCASERTISKVTAKTSNVVFIPYRDLKNHIKNSDVILIG